MRVTTFGITQSYLQDLSNTMQKYQNLEQQLSTGRKLNQPSDNPVAFEADISIQQTQTQTSQWLDNAKSGLSSMQNSDASMSTLQNVLGAIRTELVQATNGSNTPSDVGQIAALVNQQVQSVAQIANTFNGEQYIFSGANGKVKPLSVNGGVLVWNPATQGGTPTQYTTIGAGVKLATNVDGNQLFNNTSGSGVSLIDNLNQTVAHLQAAAASSGGTTFQSNKQLLQTDMQNLDNNINNVSALRGDLGGRMNLAQTAINQMNQIQTQLASQKSNIEDANLADVMTQLTTQQTVYQAALMSGQKMILPTLADVLK